MNVKVNNLEDDVPNLKSALNQLEQDNIIRVLINGKYVGGTTGNILSDANKSRTDYIDCSYLPYLYFDAVHPSTYNFFYDSNKNPIAGSGFTTSEGRNKVSIPSGAKYVILSDATPYMEKMQIYSLQTIKWMSLDVEGIQKNILKLKQAIELTDALENIFDQNEATDVNLAVSTTTHRCTDSSYTKSLYIPIKPHQIVSVECTVKSNRFNVFTTDKVPAHDVQTNVAIFNDNSNRIRKFTFITGAFDKYLLITYYYTNSPAPHTQVEVKDGLKVYYGCAEVGEVYTQRLSTPNISSMLMLNDQMINLLCNKQLGKLTQGYVCMSADDGDEQLALYTLPTLHDYADQYNKPIPLTMGLAVSATSPFPVLNDPDYIDIVKNAIENYNCSIGTHGLIMFTNYTREEFYNYLSKQHTSIYDVVGHYPSSVLYVSHGVSNSVMMVAGSFYGVCGSIPTKAGDSVNEWGNTARANMFALKRFSLFNISITTEQIHQAVDYALANNQILCPYWHDYIFGGEYTGVISGNDAKARLKDFVEYCISKNVNFINFGDIPTLEVNT